jgi:hypothetical protein
MYICTSQSLFSHSYVVNEWLNRHCNVQIDIGIRADELGTSCDQDNIIGIKLSSSCDHVDIIGINFHEATHIARQVYGVPHGILRVFNTILSIRK